MRSFFLDADSTQPQNPYLNTFPTNKMNVFKVYFIRCNVWRMNLVPVCLHMQCFSQKPNHANIKYCIIFSNSRMYDFCYLTKYHQNAIFVIIVRPTQVHKWSSIEIHLHTIWQCNNFDIIAALNCFLCQCNWRTILP